MQDGQSCDMIFTVPALDARLSSVVELLPGDVIFTGTPEGVSHGRTHACTCGLEIPSSSKSRL
ncbi:fumarylacetoacetate hydrolase family protein [Subtercola boreus]|nr:fumarylacetoacetate hydrolase family protein [Subtercola boreus]